MISLPKVSLSVAICLLVLATMLPACHSAAVRPTPVAQSAQPGAATRTPEPVAAPAVNLPSIADVVARVYPSVVTINTEATSYDFFFGRQVQKGAGSGWVYRQDGMIVTNNHVVEGAQKVIVGLADGRTFQADKVFRDPVTDLAIVKIEASGLPSAQLGDSSQLRVGDWVVAIGNPLGQGIRAKQGIVSGLNVPLPVSQEESLYDLIETSAAINPGNSGGPLVNMAGQVIGITSAKISQVGVEGMGYAISSKAAVPIVAQLVDRGFVSRPWLGAQLVTVTPYIARLNRLALDRGVVIGEVVPGGPAAKAGLAVRDIIIRIDDKEFTAAEALDQAIQSYKVGQDVKLTFVRGKDTRTVQVRLLESPPP